MKTRSKIILLIICAVAAMGMFSLLGFVPNMNDMYAKRFADQLFQCPTPEYSLVLERHKLAGKLNGNGNGMDFAAVMLLQTGTETTKDDLMEYYSAFSFAPAKGDSNSDERIAGNSYPHSVDLTVEEVDEAGQNRHFSNLQLTYESTMNHEKYRYYAAIIYDGGYVAGFDLRGH